VPNGLLAERGHTANIRITYTANSYRIDYVSSTNLKGATVWLTFWIGAVRDAQPVINTAATSSASVAFLFGSGRDEWSAGRTRPHGEYPYHLHC
jgi:hypothetical protein